MYQKIAVLAAIAIALSGVGLMAIQSVLASPGDPYAPGQRQSAETPAKTFAPGQLFSPGDPYRGSVFAPGHLKNDVVVGPDG